ncbi:agmatinase [Desulfotomaculum copahuensis]|uniref:Agmatinase n=1 Tax=Desulfotomaculum copahuensis TaxID=1838280 RepID=A0A1B7LFQ0_9FIRM|nr:agmatinase [Desulfotomaculum copahuensis]OAT82926.1 agmatinase [Desulfotomaculum copahuensis]
MQNVEKYSGFMGCVEDYTAASLVLLGAPMDFTVSFRPGARFGPEQIRRVSVGLEEYSPSLDRDLSGFAYYDAGDVCLVPGRIEASLHRIGRAVGQVMADGKFPLLLGGEHLVTLPAVEATTRYFPELAVIHFDAHADLRDDYLGERLSHATVMRRVAEVVGGKNIYQFGIRSGTREEFAYARAQTNLFRGEIISSLRQVLERLKGRPLYITLDIDVLDPAYAPGTGTPEPGGCTPGEIFTALYMLKDRQIVGMDLVEVCPACDPTESTALLAAKLVREAILSFARTCV